MTNKNLTSTAWKPGQSGNPKGRAKGSINYSMRLRKMIDCEALIARMQEAALKGNTRAAELLLERALPPLRPIADPVKLPGVTVTQTLTEKAGRIVELTAQGKLSPDLATSLVSAIGQLAKVAEVDELVKRIEALEEKTHEQTTDGSHPAA